MDVSSVLLEVQSALHSENADDCTGLARRLGDVGKQMIAESTSRSNIITDSHTIDPLVDAWKSLSRSFATRASSSSSRFDDLVHADDADQVASSSTDSSKQENFDGVSPSDIVGEAKIALAVSLARLTRNILAGAEWGAKEVGLRCEPFIRSLAYQATSFDKIKEPLWLNLQRAIYQTYSNLFVVTPVLLQDASGLSSRDSLLSLALTFVKPERREDEAINRGLDSEDPSVNLAIILCLQNILRLGPSLGRYLASSTSIKITSRLLDKIAHVWSPSPSTNPEEDERIPSQAQERCFDAAVELVDVLFEQGLGNSLYRLTQSPGEPISPSQSTILKLLDARLHHQVLNKSASHLATSAHSDDGGSDSIFLLSPAFDDLSAYALTSMNSKGRDDGLLPRVLEGLVLDCQCINALILGGQAPVRQAAKERTETFIALLHSLDRFIPRLKPFRPSDANRAADHDEQSQDPLRAFATLKRDLVQVIGSLAHEDREVQDRVREAGGVETILSMCVADDANPFIREHALFAVRHLLISNPENQAIISKMDPLGVVDPVTGELREMPERMGVKTKSKPKSTNSQSPEAS